MPAFRRSVSVPRVTSLALGLSLLFTAGAFSASGAASQRLTAAVGGGAALAGAGSWAPAITANGRLVAFLSDAVTLTPVVPGTINVFIRDLQTSGVELVSRSTGGVAANGSSTALAMSRDGRYVAFASRATNLVDGTSQGGDDVYLRDRQLGTTERISFPADGSLGATGSAEGAVALSQNGRYVAFASTGMLVAGHGPSDGDVYVRDRMNGVTEWESADIQQDTMAGRGGVTMTGDGRYVAFGAAMQDSTANNDVFLRDRQSGVTALMNSDAEDQRAVGYWQHPSLQDDGQAIALEAVGDGLYLKDLTQGIYNTLANVGRMPVLTPDGHFVTFYAPGNQTPGDGGTVEQVWVCDFPAATTELITVTADGRAPAVGPQNPRDGASATGLAISPDGRFVGFASGLTNLVVDDTNGRVDVFRRDRQTETTVRVTALPGDTQALAPALCTSPVISANGRVVAFVSDAINLVPDDTNGVFDVFALELSTGVFERVSISTSSQEGNAPSGLAPGDEHPISISADGRFVAFTSDASDLIALDQNHAQDVYVRDRQLHTTERVSLSSAGAEAPHGGYGPAISGDGRYVAFVSADLLTLDGKARYISVYLRDRVGHTTERVSVDEKGQPNGDCYQPAVNFDGNYVCFVSTAQEWEPNGLRGAPQVLLRDRKQKITEWISSGRNGHSGQGQDPSISADGLLVAFTSGSSDMVPGDTNEAEDVFVRDRKHGVTERVSLVNTGELPMGGSRGKISADGRYVAFLASGGGSGFKPAPAPLMLRDRLAELTEIVSCGPGGTTILVPPSSRSDVDTGGLDVVFPSPGAPSILPESQGSQDIYLQHRVNLAGVRGRIQVLHSLRFGRTTVGATVDRTLTVRNTSSTDYLWLWIGAPGAPFTSDQAGAVAVPPSSTLTLNLSFQPTKKGQAHQRLLLQTSDPYQAKVAVHLSGTAR